MAMPLALRLCVLRFGVRLFRLSTKEFGSLSVLTVTTPSGDCLSVCSTRTGSDGRARVGGGQVDRGADGASALNEAGVSHAGACSVEEGDSLEKVDGSSLRLSGPGDVDGLAAAADRDVIEELFEAELAGGAAAGVYTPASESNWKGDEEKPPLVACGLFAAAFGTRVCLAVRPLRAVPVFLRWDGAEAIRKLRPCW